MVKAVRNDRKLKMENESVMQRPILDSSPSEQPCQGTDRIFGMVSPHSSRKPHQKQHECSSPEQVSERTQKQQSTSIASLSQRWNQADPLLAHMKVIGKLVQDRMGIVEIGDSKCPGEGEEKIQWR